MTSILRLTGVTKSFGGVQALADVSFDLRAGEVHALVGENGAGKSTLVKIITGAHEPDAGTIEIAGKIIEGLDPQRARTLGIAVIYQQPALFPDLTVAENISFGVEPPGFWRPVRWNDRRDRAAKLLKTIGADISPEIEAGRLTMPEQQLVEIAKALSADARLLILDEPTASLSEGETERLFGVIRRLRSQGVGVIYISHRLGELPQIADRVTVLRDGRLVDTSLLENVSPADLIRKMVGRELSVVFPRTAAQPGEVLLETRELSCHAGAVRDISLTVRTGEIVGLAGLVGAGRTELARVLFGLTPADRGRIILDGRDVAIESPTQAASLGIAYVPEDRRRHGVISELSVAANTSLAQLYQTIQTPPSLPRWFSGLFTTPVSLAVPRPVSTEASSAGLAPSSTVRGTLNLSRRGLLNFSAERRLAEEFVDRLGVKTPSVDSPVGNLSGGNQQKVALARWLATKPRVLILDEPTQGVDIGAKAEIHRLMNELANSGLAILMISSDLPEILGMSDRILVMRAGTIVGEVERADATQERLLELALGHVAMGGASA